MTAPKENNEEINEELSDDELKDIAGGFGDWCTLRFNQGIQAVEGKDSASGLGITKEDPRKSKNGMDSISGETPLP